MNLNEAVVNSKNRKFRRKSWVNEEYYLYFAGLLFDKHKKAPLFGIDDILANDWEYVIQYDTIGNLLKGNDNKFKRKSWTTCECYLKKDKEGRLDFYKDRCCSREIDKGDLFANDWYIVE